MSLKLKFGLMFFSMILLTTSFYFSGCSSAESTTGKLAFQQQDYAKAETELKKGLAIDPNDDEGWFMLGYSQIELGKTEEGQKSFQKSKSISPSYGERIVQYWGEKFNQGAREFKNGIDAEDKKDKAGAKSYFENALKSFKASSAIMPDSLKSLTAVGETYLALGKKDEAVEVFNTLAAKSNSKESAERVAKIMYESGMNMLTLKSYDAAAKTFVKVLSIPSLPKEDTYYQTSAYNAAFAHVKIGEEMRIKDPNSDFKPEYAKAQSYLEPLTKVKLTNEDLESKIYELLVNVYGNLGMNEKAEDALKKMDELKK